MALLIPARLRTRKSRFGFCARTILRALRLSQLAFGGFAKILNFFGLEFADLAGFQIKLQRTVPYPADLFDVVADLLEHLAQLTITAFDEDNFKPGILGTPRTSTRLPRPKTSNLRRSGVHAARAGLIAVDGQSFAQAIEIFF